MPWPSLLSPSLLKAPSARTSEDCFIIAVSNSLSLHPFEQAAAVLLPCLQTQSLELITTMKSSAMGRNLVLLEALEKEAMRKRFKEWMDRYHRKYKDEEEKAQRYELFKKCAEKVDKLNALPDGVTYGTNHFCDRSEEEMRPYFTGELDVVE